MAAGSGAGSFWENVVKLPGNGCWLWQASTNQGGYGRLLVNGRSIQAHRHSWQLANGPIPVGRIVCHSCDTPRCVRPDHLWLGTHRENVRDAIDKGRFARGERMGTAKLTDEQVRAIRDLLQTETAASVARKFGLPYMTVSAIKHRKAWTHI